MAQSLWVRIIRNHRIAQQTTIPTSREDPQEALEQACHTLDLPRPIWLTKNQREWDEFGQTKFLEDAFFEPINFTSLEIEFIDPDAPKHKSQDPRNA